MAAVYFCHGCPGSAADAGLWSARATITPNLFAGIGPAANVPDAVLAQFDALSGDGPVHVVGFSIGAMAALTIAAHRPRRVERVTLISAAAPLQLGDWLPDLAGAPVFRAAGRAGTVLSVLTAAQSMFARHLPGPLLHQLFATTHDDERAFVANPQVRGAILAGLRASYGVHRAGYMALLRHYVSDWSAVPGRVQAPVTLWHCEADRWAPLSMAQALARCLPDATLRPLPGGGHYACLDRAATG